MTQEALKLALEALEQWHFGCGAGSASHDDAVAAIKEALEQPEQIMQDSTCSTTLRLQGKPYPRTCKKCGLGPCIADRVQPEQEPVSYDKTEMNCFVQDLYDKKMQEGKHGHYETMFYVVHQAIKRATPPQRKPLTLGQKQRLWSSVGDKSTLKDRVNAYGLAIEAAHGIKE